MWKLAIATLFCVSATALADAPLKSLKGNEVRVSVASKPKKALLARVSGAGWRLELRDAVDGTAEVFDVTPGTPSRTFVLAVHHGDVAFGHTRFAGGHVYRVAVRADESTQATSGFVFLEREAPVKVARPQKPGVMRLELDSSKSDDDEMPVVAAKGKL